MLERGFEFAPGYRLQEFLGRGQFGQVWRASAPGGTAAAVKFIDLTEGSGQKEYAGVKRVKQIRQANLMPITAIWLLDKHGKIIDEPPEDASETMDFSAVGANQSGMVEMPQEEPAWLVVAMLLGGQSLLHRLRECVKEGHLGIPPKELLSYMDESAKGLDFLNEPRHDLGEGLVAIQHCDVKPANIVMIGTSAVVCDFGLARILSRNQVTATSASGTPAYMAPEAISGKPSRTSDQYSLAVTYYHLRTGSLPIKDGTLFEVLDAHRQGKLDFGGIGESEQAVLRKATELEWEQRFESNADFVDALREALRSEGFTKPRFIVPVRVPDDTIDSPSKQGSTEDPVATMDTDFATPSPDKVETADIGTAQTAGDATVDRPVWLSPKLLIPIAICLLAVAGFTLRPDRSDTDIGDPPNPPPTSDQSADALLASAIEAYATNEAKAVELFTSALGKDSLVSVLKPQIIGAHQNPVESILQTTDGGHLVTVGYDKAPSLWSFSEIHDGASQYILKEGASTIYRDAVDLSSDGKTILCGIDNAAYVWTIKDADTLASQITLPTHEEEILAVAWYPGAAKYAVTASGDGKIGVAQLGPAAVDSPNGSVVKSAFVDSLVIPSAMRFDSSGQYLVLVSEQGEVKALPWIELIKTLSEDAAPAGIDVNAEGTRAKCFDFAETSDGKSMVAVGSLDGSITLWQLGGVQQHDRYPAHDGSAVEAIRVAHPESGDVIAAVGDDGKISVWPIGNPAERKTFPASLDFLAAVDISPDGRWIAAGGNDGSVWLWDHAANKATQIYSGEGSVDSVRIDVKGRWLIAGGEDGKLRAWDLVHCKLVALSTTVVDVKLTPKQPSTETQAAL